MSVPLSPGLLPSCSGSSVTTPDSHRRGQRRRTPFCSVLGTGGEREEGREGVVSPGPGWDKGSLTGPPEPVGGFHDPCTVVPTPGRDGEGSIRRSPWRSGETRRMTLSLTCPSLFYCLHFHQTLDCGSFTTVKIL